MLPAFKKIKDFCKYRHPKISKKPQSTEFNLEISSQCFLLIPLKTSEDKGLLMFSGGSKGNIEKEMVKKI